MKWEALWNMTTERTRAAQKNQARKEPKLCFWVWYESKKDRGDFRTDACGYVRNSCDRGKEEKPILFIPSFLSFETHVNPFLPYKSTNIHMSFGFQFLYSFLILDFTSPSKYKLWRFLQEFRCYFFHIIFFKIRITSEMHSIMHKNRQYSYNFRTKNHWKWAWPAVWEYFL